MADEQKDYRQLETVDYRLKHSGFTNLRWAVFNCRKNHCYRARADYIRKFGLLSFRKNIATPMRKARGIMGLPWNDFTHFYLDRVAMYADMYHSRLERKAVQS